MIEERYCPNCSASLEDQSGFDPNLKYWTCRECGAQLINPNNKSRRNAKYEDVVWYCDSCGAILNEQSYFSDRRGSWVCKECGYKNQIDQSNIISSISGLLIDQFSNSNQDDDYDYDSDDDDDEDYDYDSDDDDDEDYDYDSDDDDDEDYDYDSDDDDDEDYDYDSDDEPQYQMPNASQHSNVNAREDKSEKMITIVLTVAFVCFFIIIMFSLISERIDRKEKEDRGMITAGSYSDYKKENYETVKKQFEAMGFYNIEVIEVKDINPLNNGKVTNISINGNSSFSSSDYFYKSDKVIIEHK